MSPQDLTFRRVGKRRRNLVKSETPSIHLYRTRAYLNVPAAEKNPIGVDWFLAEERDVVKIQPVYREDEVTSNTYMRRNGTSFGCPIPILEAFRLDPEARVTCYELTPHGDGWIFSGADLTECL